MILGEGAQIPIHYFLENIPEGKDTYYYLTEEEISLVNQWKEANPGRPVSEMDLYREGSGINVLFSGENLSFLEGGLAWKLALEEAYPALSTIFINSYDQQTKELRGASDAILVDI